MPRPYSSQYKTLGDPMSKFEIQPCKKCRLYPFVRSEQCAKLASKKECHGCSGPYSVAQMGAPPSSLPDKGAYYWSASRPDAPECACKNQLVKATTCSNCSSCNYVN